MTHFSVAVVIKSDKQCQGFPGNYCATDEIARLMAPYDENKEVEPYVQWSREIAAKSRAEKIAEFEKIVAEGNSQKWNLERVAAHLAELIATTDEAYYQDRIGDYGGDMLRDGNGYSTYNPKSEWDYWHREEKAGTVKSFLRKVKANAGKHATYVLVTSDGEWHEMGDVGWWGITSNEKEPEAWDTEYAALLEKEDPQSVVYVLDAHI